MLERHFILAITANAVAWYAAIIATIGAVVQISNYFRDRVKIKVSFQRNKETANRYHAGKTITLVRVVNTGRRPVTITRVAFEYLQGDSVNFNGVDVQGPMPRGLGEGQHLEAYVDQNGQRFADIKSFTACDAACHKFHAHVAPLNKRTLWYLRGAWNKLRTPHP